MRNQLEDTVQEQQNDIACLKQMLREQQEFLREQQAELASLREALAQKTANHPAPTVTAAPAPVQLKTPDTSRRKMLKRMGLAVLAGGAALGVTAATSSPAEARISVNPTTKIGAVITRTGKTITNISTSFNYGLIASADDSLDASGVLPGLDVGVLGNSSDGYGVLGYSSDGDGVYGNSNNGYGVYGKSNNGYGVLGYGSNYAGVYGQTGTATSPAIVAQNLASVSGIALRILQGGLTVTGAGIGTATCAFVHKTSATPVSHVSVIDNPLCNNRPDALLFVTHNFNPPNPLATNYLQIPFGVFYNGNNWTIYLEDHSTIMPANTYFNVLIINP